MRDICGLKKLKNCKQQFSYKFMSFIFFFIQVIDIKSRDKNSLRRIKMCRHDRKKITGILKYLNTIPYTLTKYVSLKYSNG